MSESIQVLIVDDQPQFRRAAARLISAVGGFEIIGEATSGEEALTFMAARRADLVLMDVRMPGIGGPEATRRIRADHPATRVVLVSVTDRADLAPDVGTCGAERFIKKDQIDAGMFERLRRSV
jgi:two-component system, NarL family, invasion response regulator UvrY